eukprot:11178222-Lingulodinium_polyedra.AAC.1
MVQTPTQWQSALLLPLPAPKLPRFPAPKLPRCLAPLPTPWQSDRPARGPTPELSGRAPQLPFPGGCTYQPHGDFILRTIVL